MTAAGRAVAHILRRIQGDPRVAYYFDPYTESMELLTAAHAEANNLDAKAFRNEFFATLRFEKPQCCGHDECRFLEESNKD